MKNVDSCFFEKQTASSKIKAQIVAEYFPQYCKIILKKNQQEIRYLDLFSGPGIYEDKNLSTPLLIGKACAIDASLAEKVHFLFNDNTHSEVLKNNFHSHFPEGTFKYAPKFGNKTVGEDEGITKYLSREPQNRNKTPTLLFFDPFGYKGIDTLMLAKFLSHWGNEIFLFVNIKRINQSIQVGKFDEMMKSLFPTTINSLRKDRKYSASVVERLALIMDNLAIEFRNAVNGTLYDCAFKFQEEDSVATSHYIVHFTKHPKGYELVKQIYYGYDNIGAALDKDGNYTFDAKRMGDSSDTMLYFGDENIFKLTQLLQHEFGGKCLSARELFDYHHPKTKWAGPHYVKTLRKMVEDGKIKAKFTDNAQHKVSVLLIDQCVLEFK